MTHSKVAIVTGASRGIGASIARRLGREGYSVVVNFARNETAATEVVAAIKAAGGTALAGKADVSRPEDVEHMFNTATEAFGGVDVLVNNAGVMKLSPIADADDDLIDSQIAINLKGSLYTMRKAAQVLRNEGRIVNLSTSVVGLKMENYGIYASTKAAVETMSGILAKELRGRQITVNSVAPGPTGTDLFLNGKSPEIIKKLANMNPLERLGTPEDIAAAVSFLVSQDGQWINGQVLRANGGMI